MSTHYISKNLKSLRERKGVTPLQIQSVLGISRSSWSGYENDKHTPPINDLIQLSKFFEVSLDELITEDLKKREILVRLKNFPTKPPCYVYEAWKKNGLSFYLKWKLLKYSGQ